MNCSWRNCILRRSLIALLAAALGLTGCAVGNQIAQVKPVITTNALEVASVDLSGLTVVKLIDQLRQESNQGLGTHATAWVSGFAAIEEEPRLMGGVLGSGRPVTSPAMRELVRRGVAALPELIDHLSDARPTKLVVTGERFFTAIWQSDEYDPRDRHPGKQPGAVNRESIFGQESYLSKYTLRVGDLCYVAAGQIVNRGLNAIRYQPSACLVINSPVETPRLAEAVRKDWAGLKAEEHKQSLTLDALRKSPFSSGPAIKRLCFYYPEAGETLAVKLLGRPMAGRAQAIWDFVMKRLVKEKSREGWLNCVEQFRLEEGPAAADLVPYYLYHIYWLASILQDRDFREGKVQAEIILAKAYPEFDPYAPSFINAAVVSEQQELIEGLSGVQSERIDQAVAEVFRAAMKLQTATKSDRISIDDLAQACMTRLQGRGSDELFVKFLKKRIRAIKATWPGSSERYRLAALAEWLKRLEKSKADTTSITPR